MSFSPGGAGGGSGSISTSSDVTLNNPTGGHTLSYNGTTGKWINAAQQTAVIFYDTDAGSWPLRSSVGNPLTVEWRGPNTNRPPINASYARNGFDTFYAIS